jgi:hypothetical protein
MPHQNSRESTGERTMKNPLESIVGTIISGFVLTGILYLIVSAIV